MPIAIKRVGIAALMLAGFVLVLLGMHIAEMAVGATWPADSHLGSVFHWHQDGPARLRVSHRREDHGSRHRPVPSGRERLLCPVPLDSVCGFDERCHPDVVRAKAALLRGEGKEKGESSWRR